MAGVHIISHVETGTHPHWRAAVWSGVIAGLVFLVLELLLMAFTGVSIWAPVNMIGAIMLGEEVLSPAFNFVALLAALVAHFVLAIVFGLILSYIVYRLEEWAGIAVGAVFGLLLYWINFYGFTAAFPWFAEARGGISLFAHLIFGIVAAWSYKELAKREINQEKTH